MTHPSTLIIGLGNPILGDDGVGWRVAEEVAHWLEIAPSIPIQEHAYPLLYPEMNLEIDCLAVGGLALMERIIGYKRIIIIDAITTGQNSLGTVLRFDRSNIPDSTMGHLASIHDTSFANAIKVGKMMGAEIPEDIIIIGIEAEPNLDFSENLSPQVFSAIKKATNLTMELIK